MKRVLENPDAAFKLLCDHSPDAVFIVDVTGQILHANPAAYHLFGDSEKSMRAKPFRDLLKREGEWRAFLSFMESASMTLRLYEVEMVRKDGQPLYADISLAALEVADTRIVAVFVRDVTKLRVLLEEREKGEMLLHDIFNAIEDGISLLDRDLTIVRTNTWMEKMYQRHLPLVGKKCYTVYQERTTPCPWCPSLLALKEGVPHMEIVPYSLEASKRWLELYAYPVRDLQGKISGVVEYVKDITDRKNLQEQLIASEEKYRRFFENSAVFAYITGKDGKVVEVNEAALALLGYSREEFEKLTVYDVYADPAERDWFEREMEKKGSVKDFPIHLKNKAGEILTCLDNSAVITDADGHVIQYQGIIRDVTEQEKREREVRRFYALLNQMDAEVVITDVNGTIEYVNPAFERITGYTAAEARGQNPRILKSGKHDEAFYKNLWDTITGGKSWHGRFINRRKDGTLYHEDAVIFPVFDENGAIANYAAIKRDITREVALEEQLQQAAKLEAIGQLVGGIAHDFNNILTSIQGFAELALSKITPKHSLWSELAEIRSSANQASRITQQLLGFSRKQMISPKPVSGNRIIEEISPLLQRYIGEDIQLVIVLSPKRDVIVADRGQLEQCLLNLVVNARDAILAKGRKGEKRTITIETDVTFIGNKYLETHIEMEKGNYFVISVSDTGIGMEKDVLSKIFDPFFTTKPEGKGTGLGCSTVFGIVKQNKGMVRAYSEPKIGTTVKIYWPLASKGIVVEKKKEGSFQGSLTGQETILVVEDDASIRKLVKQALEMAGYRVFESESGTQALKLVKEKELSVDLLFTDIIMTGMTGDELAKILREKIPELKVLFSSGYTQNHIFQNGILKPGTRFLHKPYAIQDLLRKIREVLDSDEGEGPSPKT